MKTTIKRLGAHGNNLPPRKFTEWCDEHGLELEINERRRDLWHCGGRYWCRLPHVEQMIDGMLGGPSGNGDTELAAVQDLVRQLQGMRVAVNAYTSCRRNLDVPNILECDWSLP